MHIDILDCVGEKGGGDRTEIESQTTPRTDTDITQGVAILSLSAS